MPEKNLEQKKECRPRYRYTEREMEMIQTLAREQGISENQVVENAINAMYSQDILPDHLIIAKQKVLESEIKKLDKKLETICGIMYQSLPMIFGLITPDDIVSGNKDELEGKVIKDKVSGERYESGGIVVQNLIRKYKNYVKSSSISFMQNIWADFQEKTSMIEDGGGSIE